MKNSVIKREEEENESKTRFITAPSVFAKKIHPKVYIGCSDSFNQVNLGNIIKIEVFKCQHLS